MIFLDFVVIHGEYVPPGTHAVYLLQNRTTRTPASTHLQEPSQTSAASCVQDACEPPRSVTKAREPARTRSSDGDPHPDGVYSSIRGQVRGRENTYR
jgi:hypothetical protein